MNWSAKLEHYAIVGDLDGVRKALSLGASVGGTSKGLRTPLHHAARRGDLAIVQVLLDHKANLKLRSLIDKGRQPLHLAVRNGHVGVVQELLDRGADLTDTDNNGLSSGHIAAAAGHIELLAVLKTRGCDINSQSRDGSTPLHQAAENNRLEVVEWLVAEGASTDARNKASLTAEDCARRLSLFQVAKFLQEHTTEDDQSAGSSEGTRSPAEPPAHRRDTCSPAPPGPPQDLHPPPQDQHPRPAPRTKRATDRAQKQPVASPGCAPAGPSVPSDSEGQAPTVDPDEGDTEDTSANAGILFRLLSTPNDAHFDDDFSIDLKEEELVDATSEGDYAITARLLAEGLNIDARSHRDGEKGLTLLHLASWGGHVEVVRLLLDHRASRKASAYGLQAVHWASVGGHVPVLQLMWSEQFSIKARTEDGSTPLHLAAEHGNMDAVVWLVERGAYVHARDKNGSTARDKASEAGNRAIASYLQEKLKELKLENMTECRKLGQGSFGEVYLVKAGGNPLVMKKINLSALSRQHQEYAHREFKLLKSLSHPYIVTYKGGGFVEENLHIYMEYCGGEDLAKRIAEQVKMGIPFEEKQVHRWTLKICLALKYIHGRDIVHRDIKPHNIFLTDIGTIKLGDFGLARSLENDFKVRTFLGTPAYMSPEVLDGIPYDAKADMWALGCCLFELAALKSGLPYIQVEVPGDFSVEYKSLVESLLQREPERRPTSALVVRQPFLLDVMENELEEKELEVTDLDKEILDLNEENEQLARRFRTLESGSKPVETKPI